MNTWKNTEGIKPELSYFKGLVGAIVLMVITIYLYISKIFYQIFDVPALEILHENRVSINMQGWEAFYFWTYPLWKFLAAFVVACIIRKIINLVIKHLNKKIEADNIAILARNEQHMKEEGIEMPDLLFRLNKGKIEVKKYEAFFFKRDMCQCFYRWKMKYSVIVGIIAFILTDYIAQLIIFIVALFCNMFLPIIYANDTATLTSISEWLDPFLLTIKNIIWIVSTLVIGVGSWFYSKKMQKKADKLLLEDETNGYTAALDNVIPDIPNRYRNSRLIGQLIKLVEKHGFETAEEAIEKYEFNLKVKKGIAFVVTAIALFGIFNALNNAMNSSINEFSNNMRASTDSILKNMDESKMDSMARRQRSQQEQAMRNTWANQQQQANNLYNNAARFNPNSNEARQAMQHANDLQRKANETARQFNNMFGK